MDKIYFYMDGQNQIGPLTLSELLNKSLSSNTYVWRKGLENWKMLKEIPELTEALGNDSLIPPLPPLTPPSPPELKTETKPGIKLAQNPKKVKQFKLSKKDKIYFLLWFSFHSLALIMSLSRIDIFSWGPDSTKFWPFVTLIEPLPYLGHMDNKVFMAFNYYDWSEYFIYIIGYIIIFYLVKLTKQSPKD